MARIYEVILFGKYYVPMVRSDDENWTRRLCQHNHTSREEAHKCLVKALPRYMKHQRRQ